MSTLWLPCTQMQTLEQTPALELVKGQGSLLFDKQGKPYLDMISSWWVNLHGHCHPYINERIKQQLDTLEHTLIAGIVHPPIQQLADKLVEITPAPLTKAFFADSGSAATEVALKMSLQYWEQQGQPQKTKFVSLEHGYHGETIGSLSVTDIPLFSHQYRAMLVQQIRVPSPAALFKSPEISVAEHEAECLTKLEAVLQAQAEQICAIIIEPLVQGAAGMAMYSMDYLVGLVQLAKTFNIHVIFDEIAVGFGRTGHMFVCEQLQAVDSELCPDFVCLSKGLTAGYLPMSCVMTTDEVYNTFVDENVAKGFLHSHSFTGNPLAATAGLASLELFEQHQIIQANQTLIAAMAQGLKDLVESDLPIILPRQTGMIVAFTLDFAETRGKELAQFCLQQGVMIRPIGNHVYLIPPYCTTVEQLAQVFGSLTQGIKLLAQTTATSSPSIALA